jgi:hypothetical protein
VPANEIWQTEWFLIYQANTTADLKVRWTFPGGTLYVSSAWSNNAGTLGLYSEVYAASPSTAISVSGKSTGAGAAQMWPVDVLYINGGTPGDLVLEWAQDTSDANATIMKANSTLWGAKIA